MLVTVAPDRNQFASRFVSAVLPFSTSATVKQEAPMRAAMHRWRGRPSLHYDQV